MCQYLSFNIFLTFSDNIFFCQTRRQRQQPAPEDGGNGCERPETTVCATEICFCIKSTRPEGIDPLDSASFLHRIYKKFILFCNLKKGMGIFLQNIIIATVFYLGEDTCERDLNQPGIGRQGGAYDDPGRT